MKHKMESQLETKATAELQEQIELELKLDSVDKSVASLFEKQEKKEHKLETTGECD
jgi:hypothetical protein